MISKEGYRAAAGAARRALSVLIAKGQAYAAMLLVAKIEDYEKKVA